MARPRAIYLNYFSFRFGYYPGQDDITKDRPVAFLVRAGSEKLQFRIGTPGIGASIRSVLRNELTGVLTDQEALTRWIAWAVANPDEASVDAKHLWRSTLVRVLLHIVPNPDSPSNYSVTAVAVENERKEWHEFKMNNGAAETLEDTLRFAGVLINTALQAYSPEQEAASPATATNNRRIVH